VGIDKGIKPPFPLKKPYLEQQKREGMQFQKTHDGLLPQNEFWNYLRWRRSLNSDRFDHYHPGISCMMKIDNAKRENLPITKTFCLERPIPPIATPEPSSVVAASIGIAFVLMRSTSWRKQKTRSVS